MEATRRQFFIQTIERGSNGTRLRGVGSAGDVEIMWVKGRKPLSHLKKKPRTHYGGSSASLMYSSVKKPPWKALTQVDGPTKAKNLQLSMYRHPESLQVGHGYGEEETSHPSPANTHCVYAQVCEDAYCEDAHA